MLRIKFECFTGVLVQNTQKICRIHKVFLMGRNGPYFLETCYTFKVVYNLGKIAR